MHAEKEKKEQISTRKDNIFLLGEKYNNSSSTISNNSLKHSGSKSETEETSNTINTIPTPDDNNKKMKESAYNSINKKDKNDLRYASS